MESLKIKKTPPIKPFEKVLEIDISEVADSIEITNTGLSVKDREVWKILREMDYFGTQELLLFPIGETLIIKSPYTVDFEFSEAGNKLLVVYKRNNNSYYSLEKQ